MERQVKERLVGAAVLVAAAIILVPEMLSGPEKPASVSGAENPAGSVKTYSIDLQQPAGPMASVTAEPPPVSEETPTASSAERDAASSADDESTAEPFQAPVAAENPESAKPNTPSVVEQPAEKRPPAAVPPATEKTIDKAVEKKPASSSGGWAIQVGSFTTQEKAKSVSQGLEKRGFSTFVRTATVNGKVWYRVRVGPMAERSAAESMLAKVKASQPSASVVPQ